MPTGTEVSSAVWTMELLLEPVATVSSATGSEQKGRLCLTWAEEQELPLAEPKERGWSMAAACTSELLVAPAGLSESRQTFQ